MVDETLNQVDLDDEFETSDLLEDDSDADLDDDFNTEEDEDVEMDSFDDTDMF